MSSDSIDAKFKLIEDCVQEINKTFDRIIHLRFRPDDLEKIINAISNNFKIINRTKGEIFPILGKQQREEVRTLIKSAKIAYIRLMYEKDGSSIPLGDVCEDLTVNFKYIVDSLRLRAYELNDSNKPKLFIKSDKEIKEFKKDMPEYKGVGSMSKLLGIVSEVATSLANVASAVSMFTPISAMLPL